MRSVPLETVEVVPGRELRYQGGPLETNYFPNAAVAGVLVLICLTVAACGGDHEASAEPLPEATPVASAIAVQNSRDTGVTNDFLRLLYIAPKYPPPAKFGLDPKKRLFFQASQFLVPPLTVRQDIMFPGLGDSADQILYALRCEPPPSSGADPMLATWPNLFGAVAEDFGDQAFACPPPTDASPENIAYCKAVTFEDTPAKYAADSLMNALSVGMQLFSIMVPSPSDPTKLIPFPTYYYAAYPPFTGLGYAVSGSGDDHMLSAADTSRNMIVPEYLLKNISLVQGNCHCIGVPPTPDPNTRLDATLDVDLIWKEGDGSCPLVSLQ